MQKSDLDLASIRAELQKTPNYEDGDYDMLGYLIAACTDLCDYIDSLDTDLKALDWYRFALMPRLKPTVQEGQAIHGMWEKPASGADDKVTLAQVRDFVNRLGPNLPQQNVSEFALKVMDFIDNGPRKPTAEEIIEKCLESDYELNGTRIAMELREAGYLNDGEK